MATWSGWEAQFLNKAGILNTPPNQQILTSWAANAHSDCPNNPIDLSVKVGAATKCANNTGIHPTTWHYLNHSDAATAFDQEIHQSWAKALLDAMNTGNPYQVAHPSLVGSVFVSWGSPKMLNVYLTGEPGSGGSSSHAHQGWKDLQTSVNKRWPAALRSSQRQIDAALRSLGHTHKVKR